LTWPISFFYTPDRAGRQQHHFGVSTVGYFTMVKRKRFFPAVAAATVAWLSSPVSSLSVGTSKPVAFASIPVTRRRRRVCYVSAVDQRHQSGGEHAENHRKAGWHRSVLKKVFRKNTKSLTLNEAGSSVIEDASRVTPEFLLHNLNGISPSSLFGATPAPTAGLVSFNLSTVPVLPLDESFTFENREKVAVPAEDSDVDADAEDDEVSLEAEGDGRSPLTRITSSVAESILTGLVDRLSKGSHVNLSVKCAPNGNAYDLLRGHFQSDASVTFDRLVFPCIRMSGGRLEAHRLAINLWSFTRSPLSASQPTTARRRRYPSQFDFVAHDMIFTQDDLFQSNCIRNGLRRLLVRILKNHMSLSSVSITSIRILTTSKVAIRGKASTGFGPPVPFEVRTFLDTRSRAHVLTLPGLEISLGPSLVFVPVLPEVSLDLGHNAQLLAVCVDGQQANLRVSARATITPHHTLKLANYVQAKDSYLAPFSVDVGGWLTKVGNFTH
jgi:hypothetical protein